MPCFSPDSHNGLSMARAVLHHLHKRALLNSSTTLRIPHPYLFHLQSPHAATDVNDKYNVFGER